MSGCVRYGSGIMKSAVCSLVILALYTSLVGMPASASSYTLDIFGNANMDGIIDEDDVKYVEGIIGGNDEETELADANRDGTITREDIDQIEAIISGMENELTLVDSGGREVTVKKPVERIVVFHGGVTEAIRSLGAGDKIVSCNKYTADKRFYQEFGDFPNVGYVDEPNYEAILECDPDVVFLFTQIPAHDINCENIRNKLDEIDPSITVVGADFLMARTYVDEMRTLGYILDKEVEAEEFIDFYGGWMEKIADRLEGISEEDKPDVYFEMQWPSTYSSCSVGLLALHEPVIVAGGNNIFGDFDGAFFDVDPEAVMENDPDIILKYEVDHARGDFDRGFGLDQTKLAELRDEIINRPELQNVTAVRGGRVYIISWDVLLSGGKQPIGMAYMAKWFYPERFKDIDYEELEVAFLEYLRYQGFECDPTEIGALVYPRN